MRTHLEKNIPVRMWDPVFQGIFAHSQEITLDYRDIDGGIEVTETSDQPEVVELILRPCQESRQLRRRRPRRGTPSLGR